MSGGRPVACRSSRSAAVASSSLCSRRRFARRSRTSCESGEAFSARPNTLRASRMSMAWSCRKNVVPVDLFIDRATSAVNCRAAVSLTVPYASRTSGSFGKTRLASPRIMSARPRKSSRSSALPTATCHCRRNGLLSCGLILSARSSQPNASISREPISSVGRFLALGLPNGLPSSCDRAKAASVSSSAAARSVIRSQAWTRWTTCTLVACQFLTTLTADSASPSRKRSINCWYSTAISRATGWLGRTGAAGGAPR